MHVLTLVAISFADSMVKRALLPQYVISLVCADSALNPDALACDAQAVVNTADTWTERVTGGGNAAALLLWALHRCDGGAPRFTGAAGGRHLWRGHFATR